MREAGGPKVEEENSREGLLLERSPGTAGGRVLLLQPKDLELFNLEMGALDSCCV